MKLIALSHARFLRRTFWSTAAVIAGIGIGVTSVVGVHLISETINASVAVERPPHLRGLTHLYVPADAAHGDYFALREKWRSEPFPEVLGLMPILEGSIMWREKRIAVYGADIFALIGADGLAAVPAAGDYRGVWVSEDLGLTAGEAFETDNTTVPVNQVLGGGYERSVFGDIAIIQGLLGTSNSQVHLVGAAVIDPLARLRKWADAFMPGISAGLPVPGAPPLDPGWEARFVGDELTTQRFSQSVLFNLGALGLLAVVVAWFLLHQVAVVWLARLAPTYRRLQYMGVTLAGLRGYFFTTLLVLSVGGTLLGIAGGLILARALVGFTNPAGDVVATLGLSWVAVIKGAVTGVGVGLVGGYIALRRFDGETFRWQLPVSVSILLLGLIAVVGVISTGSGLTGAFMSILCISLMGVLLVRPALRTMHGFTPGLRRLLHRSAIREVTSQSAYLGVALGALVLAIATSIGVGLMVASFRIGFIDFIDQRLSHDVYMTAGGSDLASLAAELERRGKVRNVHLSGRLYRRLGGQRVEITFADMHTAVAARYGHGRALESGEAMISENLAEQLDADVGDTVTVDKRELRIVHRFPGYGAMQPRLLMHQAEAANLEAMLVFDRLDVDLAAGVNIDDLAVPAAVQVTLQTPLKQRSIRIFDRTFAITNALTLLAIVVATLGLYVAMLALGLNQQPARRLLTALGVDSMQERAMSRIRAVFVGVTGCLLALPLGIAMAWILCNVVNPRGFGWRVDLLLVPSAVAWPLLMGMLAAFSASWLPRDREQAPP